MKLSFAVLALAGVSAASSWFGNAAYNKWHETELERWLSDNNIPYPTPSDRKDLENLVKDNWEDYVVKPYSKWDTQQLTNYITSQGKQVKKGTEKNTKSLAEQVQGYWHETNDDANDAYHSVQDWIFNTWTESQLKSFLDYNGVPNPSPRTRDSLLTTVRSNYQDIANKAGETYRYPGNWIYSSWSDSDVKSWLDERGVPVPQPSSRDKMIASLRRSSRLASNDASSMAASASKSAAAAQGSLSDQLLDSWSESQVKEWLDKQGIKIPQGSKKNEMVALARKHSAQLTASGASAFGAATSSAGNYFAQGTDSAYAQFRYYYDYALNQVGMASKEASASLSSASSVASLSLSSASSVASVEASKSSIQASKSALSASKQASKSGSSVANSAKSAASAAKREL